MASVRKLKHEEAFITRILDELDERDGDGAGHAANRARRFPYRVPALQVDVQLSRDATASYVVPTRNIGREGISFLIGNMLHTDCACQLHLITIRNNWQTVTGRVVGCRYIQGSACVHEVDVAFDRPIDPASFAPTAIRARLLLADDSAMARRLLSHMLASLNVEVICVENGLEAVQLAENEPFDLLLMDIEMPVLDGLSAVRILRSKGYVRAIVAISAMSNASCRERCLLAGCDDFLAKPPQMSELAAVVNLTKPEPLVSSLLHKPDMIALIDDFVAGLPERIVRLEGSFAERNMEELARDVRALKGEGGGFGFEPITAAAIVVEDSLSRKDDQQALRLKLRELIRLCLAARPASCEIQADVRPADAASADDDESELLTDEDGATSAAVVEDAAR